MHKILIRGYYCKQIDNTWKIESNTHFKICIFFYKYVRIEEKNHQFHYTHENKQKKNNITG